MIEHGSASGDERYMRRALELALEGWGQVAPNPLVGAVVVSGRKIVGEGYHARYGSDHAERVAIASAGELASGATLYVSLEPCAHQGQTPPCTEAILESHVECVVFACRDPDPVAGGGAAVLRAAGIEARGGICALEAVRLNGPFLWRRMGKGPWITLKMAMSLDGQISEGEGIRTAITGPEAGAYVHRLRAGHDAILVGGRTAVVDDPLLTVRSGPTPRRAPQRIVLDPMLEVLPGSRLAQSVSEAPVILFCRAEAPQDRRRALEARGVEVVSVSVAGDGVGLDLAEVMDVLKERGVESILAEGGGRLAAALLDGGFVHRQHLLFGAASLGPRGVPGIPLPSDADSRWAVIERGRLGQDELVVLEDRGARDTLMEAA